MNYKMLVKSLGNVLCIEAASMLAPVVVSIIYRQNDTSAFIYTILIVLCVGLGMRSIKTQNPAIFAKDGYAIVALAWLAVSFFGALPFVFSGTIPSLTDAVFESVSGFSTTGASILREVEHLPKGILFWRSFTHWIGGMGVLVLMIAVLPRVNATSFHILRAESPGPSPEKFTPKIRQVAKTLYIIYFFLTGAQIIFLLMGGISLFDALVHAFGTAGTGGFSSKNASVAAFGSVYIEVVITVFMFMFGINFSLYYALLKKNIKTFFKNKKFKFYLGTVFVAILFITLNIRSSVFKTVEEALRHASFQVSSIITTTGYSSTDFTMWPIFSQIILVMLMFVGASAGSTGGGIKFIRVILLFKIAKREITKLIHPNAVKTVKLNGKTVSEEMLWGAMVFFFVYIVFFAFSVVLVALDNKDFISSFSAVASTLGNIGPGLGVVGPAGNYADFSFVSKLIMTLCMVMGRLEIYPILLLLVPDFWKRASM